MRSQAVLLMMLMADSILRFWAASPARNFSPDSGLLYDSGPARPATPNGVLPPPSQPGAVLRVGKVLWSPMMPYALFCNDARLSNAYPTEADVWELASRSGLVVEAVSEKGPLASHLVLDNDYEIRPCRPDPEENPERNQAKAERETGESLPIP